MSLVLLVQNAFSVPFVKFFVFDVNVVGVSVGQSSFNFSASLNVSGIDLPLVSGKHMHNMAAVIDMTPSIMNGSGSYTLDCKRIVTMLKGFT